MIIQKSGPEVREILYQVSWSPRGIGDERGVDWDACAANLMKCGNVYLDRVFNQGEVVPNVYRVRVMKEGRGTMMPGPVEEYLSGVGLEITPIEIVANITPEYLFEREIKAARRGNTILPVPLNPADACCEIMERNATAFADF